MAFGISFQTRSPDRDRQTTQSRLAAVETSIAAAIAAAERERDGLKRRIDLHYDTASSLLDGSGEYGTRDVEDEQAIRQAEQRAGAGRRRLLQVDAEVAALQGLQGQLRTLMEAVLAGDEPAA